MQVSALIDERGAFVWSCYPKFDGEPIFCQLLSPQPSKSAKPNPTEHTRWHGDDPSTDGSFLIRLVGCTSVTQRYEDAAPVLITTMEAPSGAIEIVHFAPHMVLHERTFGPAMFVRI